MKITGASFSTITPRSFIGSDKGFELIACGAVTLALSEPLAERINTATGAVEVVFSVSDVRAGYEALSERGVAR